MNVRDMREFVKAQGVPVGIKPAVSVGALFFHKEYDVLCVRTADTDDGAFTSVVVADPGRGYMTSTDSVRVEDQGVLQALAERLRS